ncbi:hypothetical protein MG293_012972 [Ovis ammon polii]|uniref:IL-3 receptor alpha chain N-terminal domain-containing protein n=1 Tax=Ovis ammon polii TaxID=230172 RepID=A0AAD4Y6K5_OVIAM|nr:hypothetical protein MG293_012972 [Ovis ammon polii]
MRQDLKHFHDFQAALGAPGSMLLDPALLLTQEHQNLPTLEMNCSLNVKFDPKTIKLIWDYEKNATYGEYALIHKEKRQIKKKLKDKEYQCAFPDCSLHGKLKKIKDNSFFVWLLIQKLPNVGEVA